MVQEADKDLRDCLLALLTKLNGALHPVDSHRKASAQIELLLCLIGGSVLRLARGGCASTAATNAAVKAVLACD
jgi:hypothetical protein